MLPNLRLMIVAVLASIMGISSALGLFAEFRISHDSFLRESNTNTPLQLAAGGTLSATAVSVSVPFEFRFQAQPSAIPSKAAARPETLDRAVVATPQAAALPVSASEPAPTPVPAVNAPETPAQVALAPEPTLLGSSYGASKLPDSAATGSIASPETEQNSQQAAKQDAASDLAARTPAAAPPVQEAAPESEIAPENTSPAAPRRSVRRALRHRPADGHRVERARSAAAQNFTALQPAYQWTSSSGLQSPQPAPRHVIRRPRLARKPAAQTLAPQTAVSGTPSVNPPE